MITHLLPTSFISTASTSTVSFLSHSLRNNNIKGWKKLLQLLNTSSPPADSILPLLTASSSSALLRLRVFPACLNSQTAVCTFRSLCHNIWDDDAMP